ncbi:hypothetical protein [Paracoccus amoyensis]|uniref:hypothetical protein n=1 Tax=Paracoccus amoyensis TaxID=2760093 RepID=UPI0016596B94|nr:hypothetical protein [Paracoccus amoyensis]
MATVALNAFENLIIRLECVNYDIKRISNKNYTRQDLERATNLPYSNLLNSLRNKLKNQVNFESTFIIKNFLEAGIDSHGRKIRSPLDSWRNTIHHGLFEKRPNGNIYINFHDRNSFSLINPDESLVSGSINIETSAEDLRKLAQSINALRLEIIKIFDPDEILVGMANKNSQPSQ